MPANAHSHGAPSKINQASQAIFRTVPDNGSYSLNMKQQIGLMLETTNSLGAPAERPNQRCVRPAQMTLAFGAEEAQFELERQSNPGSARSKRASSNSGKWRVNIDGVADREDRPFGRPNPKKRASKHIPFPMRPL
ncbi:hypothetical protein KUL72_31055 [Bradyrhizobium arachidis]|uniref:hypothetical protein n=1 Tax=Bradyrhizobium arachidis TaxID=858423 RepID=UPI0021631310|nr:hypothetical protein [Bradyrhizobium arachidis]UVO35759.1 hypothetical protein KUL72_31055 [Bradyrhizobium arachidis]